jgi:hypothetical protein
MGVVRPRARRQLDASGDDARRSVDDRDCRRRPELLGDVDLAVRVREVARLRAQSHRDRVDDATGARVERLDRVYAAVRNPDRPSHVREPIRTPVVREGRGGGGSGDPDEQHQRRRDRASVLAHGRTSCGSALGGLRWIDVPPSSSRPAYARRGSDSNTYSTGFA